MAATRFFESLPSDGAFIVIHPVCGRPILLLDLWTVRKASAVTIRVEGICRYCDRYVRLEYTPTIQDKGRVT